MVVVRPSAVAAVFHARVEADLAVDALTGAAGIHQDLISLFSTDAPSGRAGAGPGRPAVRDLATAAAKAFGPACGLFYAEALLRGDVVVLVRVDGGDTAELASEELRRYGAVDVDAR